ncbi:MAG: DUF192 domain-containing protein [Acidithiobacillus sp.]
MNPLPQKMLCRESQPLLRVWMAERWWPRARGLLGRSPLQADEGFALTPCSSVHGIGMTYTVDLLFLDRADAILRVCALTPLGFRMYRGAWRTIECAPGSVVRYNFATGQQLHWGDLP